MRRLIRIVWCRFNRDKDRSFHQPPLGPETSGAHYVPCVTFVHYLGADGEYAGRIADPNLAFIGCYQLMGERPRDLAGCAQAHGTG